MAQQGVGQQGVAQQGVAQRGVAQRGVAQQGDRATWVELRVHGVSGTPPEEVLGSAHVCQVAGDDRSRSFRPADALGAEVRPPDGHVLEAFHWGRWTSGSWTQALWVLLVPFGVLNAAQFMLPGPHDGPSRRAHAACGALLRLTGAVLTVLFALGASAVLADLLAWQWLGRRDTGVPDPLLVAGALLLTALVVFLLSWIGQTHRQARYDFRDAGPGRPAPGRLPGMGHASFFDGDPDNPTLRRLHRAAGLTVVAALGLSAAAAAGPGWAAGWRVGALAVLAATALAVLLLGDPEDTTAVRVGAGRDGAGQDRVWRWRELWHGPPAAGETSPPPGSLRRTGLSGVLAAGLLAAAVVFVAAAAVAVLTAEEGGRPLVPGQGGLPGLGAAAAWAGITGTATVLVLGSTVAWLAWTTRRAGTTLHPFRRYARGTAAAIAAPVAFFLAIGLTAGLALGVQGMLNRLRDDGADLPPPPVEAPAVLQRVSYAWGLTAAVLAVLALLGVAVVLGRRRRDRERARGAMGFGGAPRLPERWIARVVRAMGVARLQRHVVSALAVFTLAGVVLAVPAVAAQLRDWGHDVPLEGWWEPLTGLASAPGEPVGGDDLVIAVGQTLLLLLSGGAVLLARGAVRAEGPRRALNVVWDVFAFWPRAAHPFVPPPYAQEVVPALVRRIHWHLGEPDPLRDGAEPPQASADAHDDGAGEPAGLVVVAAHSQGSLVALAALLWLRPEVARRVRLLTCGSQLRAQYPRAFPHYVTVDLLRRVQHRHRWLSLYRDTDPVAGPVTSWGHTPDGAGPPASYRLESPDPVRGPCVPASRATHSRHPDVVDRRTGRRECGSEWRLLDPVPGDRRLQHRAVAGIHGHSDYWTGPDWADALARVGAPVRPPLPPVAAAGPLDARAAGVPPPGPRSPAPAEG